MTTMSASAAARLARSAKHFWPKPHLLAPMHSRAVTEACRQAMSGTPGTSSSRSPVEVVSAHSCSRLTCAPIPLAGPPPLAASRLKSTAFGSSSGAALSLCLQT